MLHININAAAIEAVQPTADSREARFLFYCNPERGPEVSTWLTPGRVAAVSFVKASGRAAEIVDSRRLAASLLSSGTAQGSRLVQAEGESLRDIRQSKFANASSAKQVASGL